MPKDKPIFAATIIALRKKKKFSALELVDAMRAAGYELSKQYLCDMEKGRRVPSEDTAKAMAKVLGVDADHLVMLAGAMPDRIVKRGFHQAATKRAVKELERP